MKALLIIAAALASAPVAAQPVTIVGEAPRVAHVGFADLDLTTDAGVRTLERRVDGAARDLCDETGVQTLALRIARKSCFDEARADGREQVARIAQSRRAGATLAGASAAVQAH
jgi:UrcA family protein